MTHGINNEKQETGSPLQRAGDSSAQPGKTFLDIAGVIYLAALAILIACIALGIRTEASKFAAQVLLISPALVLLVVFSFVESVAFFSALAGIPLVSFSSSLSGMHQNWRNILSVALLLGVLCAVVAAVSS